MNQIIILCGGDRTRWKSAHPKQLVDIHGEALIDRTLRQLRSLEITPYISAKENDFAYYRDRAMLVRSERTICHSLLSCVSENHKDRTAVICGDVVWSDNALKQACLEAKPVNVYGNFFGSEIFGFSFASSKTGEVLTKLRQAARAGGRLWNFYRALIGVPFDKHMLDVSLWCNITDGFTTDFDFREQYDNWVKIHPQ